MGIFRRISTGIVDTLEHFFYRFGKIIGGHPGYVVAGSLLFVVLCLPGIPLFFYQESETEKLWVPADSRAIQDKTWVDKYFPSKTRMERLIVAADNVLDPDILRAMLSLDADIKAISKEGKYTWKSVCARLGSECWSSSLLELWSFNQTVINALTAQDILDMVNRVTISPMYLNDYNVSQVLADVKRDDVTGDIVSAGAATMFYVLKTNSSSRREGSDKIAEAWENEFLKVASQGHPELKEVYYYAVRSFSDEGGGAITGDLSLLGTGYILIIVYVSVVLGKFNLVQHRVYMSLAGVLCVGLAIGVSYGLCSYAQIPYGPVHSILPFLLLGIGIDDMFVIAQAWDTLGAKAAPLPVSEKIALTMKDAGVSITVTSLTDILAFGIGATTVLPALQSFCIYASVGILATFLLQATLFVAFLTMDQKRAEVDRDACCCCYLHRHYKPNSCSQRSLLQTAFDQGLAPFLLKRPVKIAVLVLTFLILASGIYGVKQLRQDFDPVWFLPSDSYAYKYFKASDDLYPADGFSTAVYLGQVDYYDDFEQLEDLYHAVSQDEYTYTGTVDAWFMEFKQWMNTSAAPAALLGSDKWPNSEQEFYDMLQMFIFSPPRLGFRFARDIKFSSTNTTRIEASSFGLKHTGMTDASSEIDGMNSLRDVTENSAFGSGNCFPYSRFYATFETNKIIQNELYRNLGLAFVCIFLMILLLIANLWTCALVTLAVVMAVVDVGGLMYFWGLSIDTVASVQLIFALGLAVDYSAHIGHTFMTQTGSRNERVQKTLQRIGPAVFNGGLSTFLAFVLLAGSTSYVFTTFFKVFFGVVVFGLFHGLIFLPVVLSWVGPRPYLSATQDSTDRKDVEASPKPPVAGAPGVLTTATAVEQGREPEIDGTTARSQANRNLETKGTGNGEVSEPDHADAAFGQASATKDAVENINNVAAEEGANQNAENVNDAANTTGSQPAQNGTVENHTNDAENQTGKEETKNPEPQDKDDPGHRGPEEGGLGVNKGDKPGDKNALVEEIPNPKRVGASGETGDENLALDLRPDEEPGRVTSTNGEHLTPVNT